MTGFLLKLIEGRGALPVRAIPYVTGWAVPPDIVAEDLAETPHPPATRLRNLSAYHRVTGSTRLVRPKEWDACVVRINALGARLRSSFPESESADQYARGLEAWNARAVVELPPGCFVWLDDFKNAFREAFSSDSVTLINERRGDRDLIFAPVLHDGEREVVLKGFENDPDFDPGEDVTLIDADDELPGGHEARIIDPEIHDMFAEVAKPPSVSLQSAIDELRRELMGLDSPIDLSIANFASSIENNLLDGNVSHDSDGTPDPEQSTITSNALNHLRESIRRSLERRASNQLEQPKIEGPDKSAQARFELGYWLTVSGGLAPVADWNYWMGLRHLTALEVGCLLNGLDPNAYVDVTKKSSWMVSAIKMIDVRRPGLDQNN